MKIIPHGGATSSQLNTALDEFSEQWSVLEEDISALDEKFVALNARMASCAAGLATGLAALDDVNPATEGAIYLSAFDLSHDGTELYSTISGEMTARPFSEYGLVLPDFSNVTENQFCVVDASGSRWIPRATQLLVLVNPSQNPVTTPAEWDGADQPETLAYAFDGLMSTACVVDLSTVDDSEDAHVWIKAVLPLEHLFNGTTNFVTIQPQPVFAATREGMWYEVVGGVSPVVQTTTAKQALPEAFLLQSQRVSSVIFHYTVPAGFMPGERTFCLEHLGAYLCSWNASALCTLDLAPYLVDESGTFVRQIASVTVNGAAPTAPIATIVKTGDSLLYDNGVRISLTTTAGLPQYLSTLTVLTEDI